MQCPSCQAELDHERDGDEEFLSCGWCGWFGDADSHGIDWKEYQDLSRGTDQ